MFDKALVQSVKVALCEKYCKVWTFNVDKEHDD